MTSSRQPSIPNGRTKSRSGLCVLTVSSLLLAIPAAAQAGLRSAEQDLLQGRADQTVAELRSFTANQPGSGAAHLLLCRAFLSTLHGTEAASECHLALSNGLAQDSAAQDWAGRAFGMEAEHAGPISGLKLAGQVRTAFLTAYQLNRRNPAAANDLGEFYVHAPFLVGGGSDKAASLASEIQATLPEIAHRLRALLAEKQGNTEQAEREFLAATQVAQSPGAYVDLAVFYSRQHAADKAAEAARRAIALDRSMDANIVDAASTLNDVHRTAQALPVLRSYLEHGQKSDQAPVFRVYTLMGDMLASQGDKAGARQQYQAALSFASQYGPARKGLGAL